MSTDQAPAAADRRLTPTDVQNVRFTRGSMMRPGYTEVEVDRFLARVAQELSRSIAERAELRDQVHGLREQLAGATSAVPATPEPPSDQAVRILASAQQTADNYVAEAEEFSRQMTSEARTQYEELTRQARENAGAIIQAAQEAAAKVGRGHGAPAGGPAAAPDEVTAQQLQEQIAYLRAFGQATRTQLRAYLEALLSDVEREWGAADPGGMPMEPYRTPAQRSDSGAVDRSPATFVANTAAETLPADAVATAGARSS
jgi:DivIVA domain-containing protein